MVVIGLNMNIVVTLLITLVVVTGSKINIVVTLLICGVVIVILIMVVIAIYFENGPRIENEYCCYIWDVLKTIMI